MSSGTHHGVKPFYTRFDEGIIFDSRIDIDDLNELLSTDLSSEGFETLGGFIYDHLGSIPEEGLVFQTDHLELGILKIDGQRIAQVKIRRLAQVKEGSDN